ncbi:hypothetical protein UlMin_024953 [Ulmus minor]
MTKLPMHFGFFFLSFLLSSILDLSLSSLTNFDHPSLPLLFSPDAYAAISSTISSPLSGSGSDPPCHCLYLSRVHSLSSDSPYLPSLASFEVVLFALYSSETKARAGKPILVFFPNLSQPSLYHTPRNKINSNPTLQSRPFIVKSTKRASIVGVGLECYYKQISQMPTCQDCSCQQQFDDESEITGFSEIRCLENGNGIDEVVEEISQLVIENSGLRILGHCLLAPLNSHNVKNSATVAVQRLYARASHDLVSQAILATQSLIQLDKRARADAKAAAAAVNSLSNANTPSKAKKPKVLLVSK